eukprot:1143715-Rhodomonas_salina.1
MAASRLRRQFALQSPSQASTPTKPDMAIIADKVRRILTSEIEPPFGGRHGKDRRIQPANFAPPSPVPLR